MNVGLESPASPLAGQMIAGGGAQRRRRRVASFAASGAKETVALGHVSSGGSYEDAEDAKGDELTTLGRLAALLRKTAGAASGHGAQERRERLHRGWLTIDRKRAAEATIARCARDGDPGKLARSRAEPLNPSMSRSASRARPACRRAPSQTLNGSG